MLAVLAMGALLFLVGFLDMIDESMGPEPGSADLAVIESVLTVFGLRGCSRRAAAPYRLTC
jgi:hypothetical protein